MSTAVLERKRSSTSVDKNLPARRYRPELHGVRGLAILGVVLFHLCGNGRVSGGIDIFLTISGFLFTAMLLREVTERDGVINFARYFGRLFRRIFVPAAIVIVATVAIGMVIFPFPQHNQIWTEGDRKSTRLNSSHVAISYAVFCLKKKKIEANIKMVHKHS